MVHLKSTLSNVYQAAVEYTSTSAGYFVNAYAGFPVTLAKISGTPASAVSLTETNLGDSRLRSTSDPAVPAGTLGGDLDTRVLSAAYEVTSAHGPMIAYSANTECALGGIDTVCTAIGRITWLGSTPGLSAISIAGSSGAAYTYGAVALDRSGRTYLSYSRSSATSMPAAAVQGVSANGRIVFDAVVQPPAAGTTACESPASPPCDQRWGDFMGATQDPINRGYVWVAGLYQAASGLDGWATVIARAHLSGLG
jgi:hypothetical protein